MRSHLGLWRSVLAAGAVVLATVAGARAQEVRADKGPPKVFVIPMNGPLHYRGAAAELTKILRSAIVQKPEAIVLVMSCPGGEGEAAFEIARQIADLGTANTVAYVSGEYGGVFGAGVVPLLACRRVFVAPGNTIDLRSPVVNGQDPGGPLAPRQVSLLQAWAAEARLPWLPIQEWLAQAGWLGGVPPDRAAPSTAPGTAPSQRSLPGIKPLRVQQAEDLEEVLRRIGTTDGRSVITWPDPVQRTNQSMRQVFQQADELIKATNAVIAAAREADPRAHRYELREVTRQAAAGIIVVPDEGEPWMLPRTAETGTPQDQFSDGGASWRAYTDQCIGLVRQAISGNRKLAVLAARHKELGLNVEEINESHATLSAWLGQLRAERSAVRPPVAE